MYDISLLLFIYFHCTIRLSLFVFITDNDDEHYVALNMQMIEYSTLDFFTVVSSSW